MKKRVLVIGGYGNFGRLLTSMLARDPAIQVIVAGRSHARAASLADEIDTPNKPEAAQLDIDVGLLSAFKKLAPDIVIHTSGPYQGQDYRVARSCIEYGCHYIDLADARDFVAGIAALDREARDKDVLVCSGASSVPALSAAIIDRYLGDFEVLEEVDYGITTAQRTSRGLATTAAVLSYAGKPIVTLAEGTKRQVYGWLGLRFRRFWGLGFRGLANCDIPDLAIFPDRYPSLKTVRFQAGLELKFLQIILTGLSWLVRLKLLPSLRPLAPYLLRISRVFDALGSDNSGFFMRLSGVDAGGAPKHVLFEIDARHGDGLYIPTMAAFLMARKLAAGEIDGRGARPCIGFIELDEFLEVCRDFDIKWRVVTGENADASC